MVYYVFPHKKMTTTSQENEHPKKNRSFLLELVDIFFVFWLLWYICGRSDNKGDLLSLPFMFSFVKET